MKNQRVIIHLLLDKNGSKQRRRSKYIYTLRHRSSIKRTFKSTYRRRRVVERKNNEIEFIPCPIEQYNTKPIPTSGIWLDLHCNKDKEKIMEEMSKSQLMTLINKDVDIQRRNQEARGGPYPLKLQNLTQKIKKLYFNLIKVSIFSLQSLLTVLWRD